MQDVAADRRPVTTPTRAPAVRAPAPNGGPRAPDRRERRRDAFDALLIAALAGATVLVHPVGEMLRHPYWLDEAWVAALTKAPWHQIARLTSSAPVGFVALLRLVPGSGEQRGRLVVLAFSVLTVVAAYLLVRSFAWRRTAHARGAATVAAAVVMLAPVSLGRNDLKQYTCDAFVALLLFGLGARAERLGTWRALIAFMITAVLAVPFSSTALFVATAVVVGLLAAAAAAGAWRRLRDVAVVGVIGGIGLGVWYALVVAPNVNERLHVFWDPYYLHGSFGHSLELVGKRIDRLGSVLAMPAPVFVALFVVGVVVLVRLRVHALAVAAPVLWVEMFVLARIDRYPFLDRRTSTFLLVPSLIVVALGAVGLVGAASRVWAKRHPAVGRGLAAVVAVTLAALFLNGVQPYVRRLNIVSEDVRSQALAVAQRQRPGDVILVSSGAVFGLAYYWPDAHLKFVGDPVLGQGFIPEVREADAIFVLSRDDDEVRAGVRAAVARLRAAPAGSHLYIVLSHVGRGEARTWHRAFAAAQVTPREDVVGIEPLLVLDRSAVVGT